VKSTPVRGVKQFLKPDAYQQSEPGSDLRIRGRVTAYLLHNGSASWSLWRARAGRRRRSESESEQGAKSQGADPKPGELAMGRLKVG
jgi:hypothetical protein